MKKLFLFLLTITLIFNCFIGCNENQTLTLYTPDGAPALAIAPAINKGFENIEFNVVDSQTIGTFVTGESPKADICVLPINMASNLIGNSDSYKLLGTLTHGNFYFLSKSNSVISSENLQDLVGLTIGVIQLKNIPGLTFKSVLLENEIAYTEVTSTTDTFDNKVNLIGISATEIGRDDIDLFLVPSPQADIKAKALNLNFVGSLQTLYGENGFPQAVIVAKSSVVKNNQKLINEFITSLNDTENFYTESNIQNICSLIESKLSSGLTPVFNSKNLTVKMIENSSIKFVKSSLCKEEIISFIAKIQKVDETSVKTFSDNFFNL